MENNELNKVKFLPFVGKHYEQKGWNCEWKPEWKGLKILALGESHYCKGKDCSIENCKGEEFNCGREEFTTDVVVKKYILKEDSSGHWRNTFTKFIRALVGENVEYYESEPIWNSIVLYNYLGYALGGPREAVNYEEYKYSFEAFLQILNRYKPDIVIVWGTGFYDKLPNEGLWEYTSNVICKNGNEIGSGYYHYENGKARTFAIYHPSSPFSWEDWHEVISAVIDDEMKKRGGH